MIKQWCATLLFLFISIPIFSQSKIVEYGAKAGLNFSNLSPNKELEEYYTFNSKIGFHIGAFLQYPISKKFRIKPELLLTTISSEADLDETQIDITNPFDQEIGKDYKFDIKEYLVSIPILINFKADAHFDIETGFPLSYVIASKSTSNNNLPISYYSKEKFQVEWHLGVGYLIASKYRIALGLTASIIERNNTRSQVAQLGMEYFL